MLSEGSSQLAGQVTISVARLDLSSDKLGISYRSISRERQDNISRPFAQWDWHRLLRRNQCEIRRWVYQVSLPGKARTHDGEVRNMAPLICSRWTTEHFSTTEFHIPPITTFQVTKPKIIQPGTEIGIACLV